MKFTRNLFAKAAPDVIRLPDAKAETRANSAKQPRASSGRKRLMVLLAAIAVPAMAAPGEFGALPGGAPTEAELVNARLSAELAANPAMPFERPGQSFPGSAFYFLADPPTETALIALPTTDAFDSGAAEAGRELGQMIDAGPAATPFFSVAGSSHLRASECLAQAVWYEAASESEAGQRAVAQVVLNRVSHRNWPGSVCGVVYQGSHRNTGCQFSFTCDGSLSRRPGGRSWSRAQSIAGEALAGSVYSPVGHATHYHTLWVNPYWAPSLDHVGTIGAHRFYRNRGAAGQAGAFTGRYAGFEPGVAGRTAASIDMPAIPAQSSGASPVATRAASALGTGVSAGANSGTNSGTGTAFTAPEPVLADPAYSGVGQVREGYAQAGQWKSDAARAALEADQRAIASGNSPAGSNTGNGTEAQSPSP